MVGIRKKGAKLRIYNICIRSLLPKSLSPFFFEPTIIVTSRNQNWSLQKVIHLDLWTEAEVVIFIFDRLELEKNSENESLALQLGTLFGRLPIALQSAIAVILQQTKRKKKYGLQSLMDEYESGSRKVLEQKPLDANMRPAQTRIPMLVLWNISLEKIIKFEDGKLAIKILCFMSYMSPVRIPQDFLYALFENDWSQDSFENAIVILEDYSLIASLSSDDSDSCSLSIHRMIQDSTIENLRTRTHEGHTPHAIFSGNTFLNETEVLLELSAKLLNYLKTFTTLTFPRRGELVETLVQITNHVSGKLDVEEFRNLTEVIAKVLRQTNNFSKSIELFKRALEATPCCKENLAKITQLKHEIAGAYGEGGHYKESSDLYLQVNDAFTPFIGADHKATLHRKKIAAQGLYLAGKVDDAYVMFQKVLQGYKNNGDTQNKDFLDTKRSIEFWFKRKEWTEELLTQEFKEREKYSDHNPYSIIPAQLNLARELTNEGKLKEASEVMLETIKEATERLGPFHLLTISSRRYHASQLHDQGKDAEAAPLLKELLVTEKTQLGPDNRSTLDTKTTLAAVYLATKELDKAEALLDVQIWERVFGLNDPETLKAAIILSNVKMEQRKFGDTLALCNKILKIRKNVLVPNHTDFLTTLHNIAYLHFKMGEFEKAADVAQKLVLRQKEAFGEDHPDAVKTLQFLDLVMKHLLLRADLISCFIARTSVDVETGKSILKASNWDLEAAVDTYWNSNSNALIGDQDLASIPELESSTFTQMKNDLIVKFVAVTGVDAEIGKLFLRASSWCKEVAFKAFCNSRFYKETAALNLQGQTIIASAAARAAENHNLAAASCSKTVVNQIQDVEVQVKSVAESNQPTTSILYCPTVYSADPDEASTTGAGTSTEAQIQNSLILNFMEMTEANAETGKLCLQASEWNLEVALGTFFESLTNKDGADLNLKGQALIPSAAATPTKNQNMTTASSYETEVNQIRDVGVQVELVPKPNRTTTSILFRFPGGKRLQGEFGVSSTVKDMYKFVNEMRPDLADTNYVLTMYPNTKLTEMEETLEESNLLNNAALTLKMLKK